MLYRGKVDHRLAAELHTLVRCGNQEGHVATLLCEDLDLGVGIMWDTVCDNLACNSLRIGDEQTIETR